MFDRRMEAHKGKKRKDLENELIKHLDLIEDPAIKQYIIKKKTQKAEIRKARTEKRSGVHNKMAMAMDSDLEMEEDSEEAEPVKVVAKVSTPKEHQRYLPSVDVLFSSAASIYNKRLLGVILTGMGNDGSAGVHTINRHGGRVIAEAEESCVVFGMPKEAIATGLVDRIVPLPLVCREILKECGYDR